MARLEEYPANGPAESEPHSVPEEQSFTSDVGLDGGAGVLRVALCGSFHHDLSGLARAKEELQRAGCTVLSPIDLNFIADVDGFPIAIHEATESPRTIEQRHLEAIRRADFVWLHAAKGYVGRSGAFEIGFASAIGVPIFCAEIPDDVTISDVVRVVGSPTEVVNMLIDLGPRRPGESLVALQRYYEREAIRRGYESESPQDCMLLLTEELGELARAVRKEVGIARTQPWLSESVSAELADVILYLVHLANVLDVDLGVAVTEKERLNRHRAVSGVPLSA